MLSAKSKGIIAITCSAFGFALMALFVRLCDDCGTTVSSFQKSFFRNLIALIIAVAAFWRVKGHRRSGGTSDSSGADESRCVCESAKAGLSGWRPWVLLILRAMLGTVGIFANFYALSHVTIAESQTLNKTAPFFTVLFAWLVFGEKATRRQWMPLALAFCGVLLIAKPGFAGPQAFPLSMGLMSGVCAGGAYGCVRGLRRHGVAPAIIVLFFSAFSCLASVPFILQEFDPMTGQQVLILTGAGAGAAIGQFGVTLAYGYAAPKEIAVYDYLNILFTTAFGFFFFSQVPDAWSFAGFAAILIAAYRMFR